MPGQRRSRSFRPHIPAYRPIAPRLSYHKPLATLSLEETITWLESLRNWLEQKQQRERAYLEQRAARGTYTSTDQAYEADQERETELLTLLDELLRNAREQGGSP